MSSKSNETRGKAATGWNPPSEGFPLSFHPPSRRLSKKIRGQRVYFGYAASSPAWYNHVYRDYFTGDWHQ